MEPHILADVNAGHHRATDADEQTTKTDRGSIMLNSAMLVIQNGTDSGSPAGQCGASVGDPGKTLDDSSMFSSHSSDE